MLVVAIVACTVRIYFALPVPRFTPLPVLLFPCLFLTANSQIYLVQSGHALTRLSVLSSLVRRLKLL